MKNLLVAVDHSPESDLALQTACRFGPGLRVQPIYVSPPPGHDLAMGAGWARKSWEKEKMIQARKAAEDLAGSRDYPCSYIEPYAAASGDPVKAIADRFIHGNYDLLVTGSPFRGVASTALAYRYREATRKAVKDLPLMLIPHLTPMVRILVLTDGKDPAVKMLGFLNRISLFLSDRITLISVGDRKNSAGSPETLILESGLAILKEKDIEAQGFTLKSLGPVRLKSLIRRADLLVCPVVSEACEALIETAGAGLLPTLFYISRD